MLTDHGHVCQMIRLLLSRHRSICPVFAIEDFNLNMRSLFAFSHRSIEVFAYRIPPLFGTWRSLGVSEHCPSRVFARCFIS